jgi:hypothetical protein
MIEAKQSPPEKPKHAPIPTPTMRQMFVLALTGLMHATGHMDSWFKPCKTEMRDAFGFSALPDYHKNRQIERGCHIPEPPAGYHYDSDYNLVKERR